MNQVRHEGGLDAAKWEMLCEGAAACHHGDAVEDECPEGYVRIHNAAPSAGQTISQLSAGLWQAWPGS